MASLVERMKAIKEGADTLLDNTMVLLGSGIRDGDILAGMGVRVERFSDSTGPLAGLSG